jgi:hypothetical protein
MGDVSISNALRTPKVSAHFASGAHGERTLDPRLSINPRYVGTDHYGRPAHPDTQNILTANHDPRKIMSVEEHVVRPHYHRFLNTRGIHGESEYFTPVQSTADTMGMKRNESMNKNGSYIYPGPATRFQGRGISNSNMFADGYDQMRTNKALLKTYRTDRLSQSGM